MKTKTSKTNCEERLKLLQKYAWSLVDIMKYWSCSRKYATKIRDLVISKRGNAKFTKSKVVVKDVLVQCNTTLEEEIRINNLLILKSTVPSTNERSGNEL